MPYLCFLCQKGCRDRPSYPPGRPSYHSHLPRQIHRDEMRRYCRGPDTGVGGILNERQDGALVSSSLLPSTTSRCRTDGIRDTSVEREYRNSVFRVNACNGWLTVAARSRLDSLQLQADVMYVCRCWTRGVNIHVSCSPI